MFDNWFEAMMALNVAAIVAHFAIKLWQAKREANDDDNDTE